MSKLIIETENITQSLNDRLGLDQNSLPAAQIFTVATVHSYQLTTGIPDHLRQMRVGTDMTDKNDREIEREEALLQLDGTADERDDPNEVLANIDLTASPVNNRNIASNSDHYDQDKNECNDKDKSPKLRRVRNRVVYQIDEDKKKF